MLSQTRAFSLALALSGTLSLLSAAALAQTNAQPPAIARGGLMLSEPALSPGVPFAGRPVTFSLRLQNQGERAVSAPTVDLIVPTEVLLDPPDPATGPLGPGATLFRRWTLTAERPGIYPIQVRVRAEGEPERTVSLPFVVAAEPRNLDTRGDRHPHVRADAEGNFVFRNESLVAVLQKSAQGYGPLLLYPATRTSTVRSVPVGMVPVLAQVGNGGGEASGLFQPTEARLAGDDTVRLRGQVPGGSGEMEVELYIPREPWLTWEVKARPAAGALPRLRPMPLQAVGEGPRLALFPGVEWAEGAQPVPLYTPDPYAVTVPAMAVSRFETTVGLLWDPRQQWGGTGYLRPLFGGDESGTGTVRMELSTPEATLPANQRVQVAGKLLVMPFEPNPSIVVRQWEKAFGAPITQGFPRSLEAARKLAREAYLKALWDPELKGWSPAVNDERALPPVQDAFPALALLTEAGLSGGRERSALRERAEQVIAELRQRGPLEPPLAYHAGGVLTSLAAERRRLQPWVDDQLASGGWTWESVFPPSPRDRIAVGEPGETALGIVTARALPILRYAAWTGDSGFAGPGRKALEFIDRTFVVPRGAQTFGFPLRAPSLVAATEAAECFLLGYQVSGELRYVDRARAWADAALTFVQFWGEKEKPALLHATRLSYGTGSAEDDLVAQQWAGLSLARVLRALSDIRPDGLYDYVSEGIVASALHQQYASGPRAGLLPQAWDLRENRPEGLALAPRPLLEAIYPLDRRYLEPSHVRVRIGADRMVAAGGAYLFRPWSSSTRVRLNLRGVDGQDTFLTLTNVPDKPLSVEYNTSVLRRQLSIPVERSFLTEVDRETEQGWNYDPETGVLILRLRHTGGEDHLEIRWPDPRERTPIERVDPRIRTRR